ncbi:MAG TPA: glycosyltransferase family 39 protein, partial [Gemmatimonadaceae bacterium]
MDDPARAAATSPEPVERAEFLAVVAVTLLGALCRLAAMRQPMRYDEASAWVSFIGQSWWTILSRYPTPNNHVFFSLVAKVTASLAPYQPWAIRLPALIPGIAIVPATWAVGRRLADRATALLGAALAAGSMPLVLYSANARGHSLVVLGGLGLVLLADRLRARPRWLAGWAAYVLIAALGLWTALLMIYSIAAVSLWLALHALSQADGPAPEAGRTTLGGFAARVRRALPQIGRVAAADAAALAMAALLYLPIIRSAGLSALLANKLVRPVPWPQFAKLLPPFLYELALTWSSPFSTLSLLWVVALFLLALAGLPRAHRGGPSFALAAIGGCLAPFLFSHAHPFVRMWLFFAPLFLLAAGRGLVRVARATRIPARIDLAWGALAVAVVVSGVALVSRAAEGTDDTGRVAAAH